MRINNNIPALQTYQSIKKSNRNTTASMLRLTSGYKINSAKDDAAGLAISNKMRMQLEGIEMAGRNAMDGVSLVQTADGALSEVHNMLQRMRELAVKASTDTLEDADRVKIQEEVDALITEIDAISARTEFNKLKLFGPKATSGEGFEFFDSTHTVSNIVKGVSTDEGFPEGNFSFDVVTAGTPSTTDISVPASPNLGGTIFAIGTNTVLFEEGDTQDTALAKIEDMAREMGYQVRVNGPGSISIFSQGTLDVDTGSTGITSIYTAGTDAAVTSPSFTLPGDTTNYVKSVDYQDNQIIITLDHPYLGKQAIVQVDVNWNNTTGRFETQDKKDAASGTTYSLTSTYRDYSKIILQVGPNKDMEMEIEIPQINSKTLGVEHMSYLPILESQNSINICDKAIAEVSRVRSRLGAYQNRLEFNASSLDVTSANMSQALSRITDTDMAKEMTYYTQQNVISQAGMSILAQANQRPQQILQLVGQ